MPQVIDATVVDQPYSAEGNGGRKLVRLSNGWLVASVWDSTNYQVNFYVSKNDGQNFNLLCYAKNASAFVNQWSVVSNGNYVYFIIPSGTQSIRFHYFDATSVLPTDNIIVLNILNLDSGQSGFNGNSLAINEAGTELHATWASKNSTYPNSFNIRYVKGTINGDGSVTWGAVVQTSSSNTTGTDHTNPCIIVNSAGKPYVFYQLSYGGNYYIEVRNSDNWTSGNKVVYNGGSYTQSSPSAIFVPPEISGTPNGRIWVAWHGFDNVDTNHYNIRVSYSDDNGVTWSSMQKLTNVSGYTNSHLSLTANKYNEVYIVFSGNTASVANNVQKIKYDGTWGEPVPITNYTTSALKHPSSLHDDTYSLDFTEPLFIYQGDNKVGFYGTWTTTEISVPEGDLGKVTNPSNLLTYNITTDGDMDTVIEKINGITVGTKNLSSGQNTTVSVSQEIWDDVRFGKYGNVEFPSNILNLSPIDWEQGTFSGGVGSVLSPTSSTARLRTKKPLNVSPNTSFTLSISNDYQMRIYELDENDVYVESSLDWHSEYSFTTGLSTSKLHLVVKKTGDTTIVPDDILTTNAKIETNMVAKQNILTIEMGNNTWEYTFEKALDENADLLSSVKAISDVNEVKLPLLKQLLVDKVGGDVGESFEGLLNQISIEKLGGVNEASGSIYVRGDVTPVPLDFAPQLVVATAYGRMDNGAYVTQTYVMWNNKFRDSSGNNRSSLIVGISSDGSYTGADGRVSFDIDGINITPNGFNIRVHFRSHSSDGFSFQWKAIG